jgi:hypothetical protein
VEKPLKTATEGIAAKERTDRRAGKKGWRLAGKFCGRKILETEKCWDRKMGEGDELRKRGGTEALGTC